MRRVLLPMAVLLCAAFPAFAQDAPPEPALPCPKLKVTAPDEVKVGDELKVSASLTGGDPDVTPTYNWSVTSGAISSGQGTPSITVDTADVEQDTITATVEIGGYSQDCAVFDSATTNVEPKAPAPPPPPPPR
jgi:hypothetical protein